MNKNSRQIRKAVAKASKKKQGPVSYNGRTFHAASPDKNGVVSTNPRRNTQMVISKNTDDKGKQYSITSHESINSKVPLVHKNHSYIKYRQTVEFGGRME